MTFKILQELTTLNNPNMLLEAEAERLLQEGIKEFWRDKVAPALHNNGNVDETTLKLLKALVFVLEKFRSKDMDVDDFRTIDKLAPQSLGFGKKDELPTSTDESERAAEKANAAYKYLTTSGNIKDAIIKVFTPYAVDLQKVGIAFARTA